MQFHNFFLFCFNLLLFWCKIDIVQGIIGGSYAPANRFTYHATIYIDDAQACGGAVLGKWHIVTAAHCFIETDDKFKDALYHIVVGTKNLANKNNHKIYVDKVYVPREFELVNPNPNNINYLEIGDIAIVKLSESLVLNSAVSALILPSSLTTLYLNQYGNVTGVGVYSYTTVRDNNGHVTTVLGKDNSDRLKFAETQVISNEECATKYADPIQRKHLCAKVKQHDPYQFEGVCMGDSGGPLVYDDVILIGIIVSAASNCNERNFPSIYTRVTSYVPFIIQATHDIPSRHIRTAKYNSTGLIQSN